MRLAKVQQIYTQIYFSWTVWLYIIYMVESLHVCICDSAAWEYRGSLI